MEKLNINWNKESRFNIDPALKKFENYLTFKGYSQSSIDRYRTMVKSYLKFSKKIHPIQSDAEEFRARLIRSNLKRSTINLYSAAIKQYYRMNGEDIDLPYLKFNNRIPYYLTADDILAILSVIRNLKHYAMINLCFYSMLRASELVSLDDDDINFKELTVRIRHGKGDKSAILPLNTDCSDILKQYLEIRPEVTLADGSIPLFPTDFCNRWDRRDFYRMFVAYKKKAGISIPGGPHLLRHSAATILLKNGADIMTVKELMRHERLETTARYLHMGNDIRESYNRHLIL